MRSSRIAFASAVAVCATAIAATSFAADDTSASASATASTTATTEPKPAPDSIPAQLDANDPSEIAGKTYYFVGARFSETIVPSFMTKLFLAGGPGTVAIPTVGLEGGFRKDGFDIIGAITYSSWGTDPFPAKGKSEADTAYEIIKSDLKMINLTADFLWSSGDNPKYQIQYGLITGLSFVFGDLSRVQSHPPNGDAPGDPSSYVPCAAPGNPSALYCDASNSHYGNYKEPSWFNGGDKPNVYATFGPEFGFRWKPVKQFVARLTIGWNIFAGPFFGIAGDYGL